MSKDYNNKAHRSKAKVKPKPRIGLARILLVIFVLALFVGFLVYLKVTGSGENKPAVVAPEAKSAAAEPKKTPATNKAEPAKAETKTKTPHFEFYTVLSGKEAVVSEHEIKTRRREERLGKAKASQYVIQVGSFKAVKDAEVLRAKLAAMGIEAIVDKAKLGDATLHRVKIGPFAQMASVDSVRSRLRKQGIDVMVTEIAAKTGETAVQTKPIKPDAPINATPIPAKPPAN